MVVRVTIRIPSISHFRVTAQGVQAISVSIRVAGRNVPLIVRNAVASSHPETGGNIGCLIELTSPAICTLPG
jgi:hypothetical protein